MILLNPGPVSLSPQVRAALQGEDLCHREPEFAALTQRIRHKLETLYADAQPDYAAVLLTGSGSAAVEAMLSTFARHDAPTLVISNGVYGERMASMLQRQRKPYVPLAFAWGATIDLIQVTATLDSQPGIKHVAIVHHETTTGKLNALDDLAALCQSRDIGLLVDAVSSFGGEAIPFARWRPAAIAGTANKCLHGIPGVSLVLTPHAALSNARSLATTLYLDLELYYREYRV